MNKKLEIKLRKLLIIAQQGIGGEKVNAQSILEKLLKKHNLLISDINDESKEFCSFKFKDNIEKKLLIQIFSCVLNRQYSIYKKGYKSFEIEITKRELIEIELMFDNYIKYLREEIEILFSAFIHKNNIFGKDSEKIKEDDIDQKEKDKYDKMSKMMLNIEKVNIRKQIN